jgi:hypothetical protein
MASKCADARQLNPDTFWVCNLGAVGIRACMHAAAKPKLRFETMMVECIHRAIFMQILARVFMFLGAISITRICLSWSCLTHH